MYNRNITRELQKWRLAINRKPLIIRGARQVGKTTVVNDFGKSFKQYIYLNLERKEDAQIFQNYNQFSELIQNIFFLKNKSIDVKETLIFIDEIQAIPKAINLLRYFYEDYPQYYIVAAGSLLESILNEKVKIPVGRVEYLVLRPMTFIEYLEAINEIEALNIIKEIPVLPYAQKKLLLHFNMYTLIGGMPEIVKSYVENRNLTALLPIYESLLESYINDVEKYARNNSMVQVIRQVIKAMSTEAGGRIKFEKFGGTNYKSREVGEALRTVEKALLLHLIYPTINTTFPLMNDFKKSPRLQILDTGLMNHLVGIQKEMVLATEIDQVFNGKVIEHIVGQELLGLKYNVFNELHFWTREKKDATAEVDYIYGYEGKLFPIEVKSGVTGKLRSLQLFMDACPHKYAVRLYSGKLSIDKLVTGNGKEFYLLNMPYYLISQIENYLDWFLKTNPN
jgi:uncharacterized protein